jgi:hypothetical protein
MKQYGVLIIICIISVGNQIYYSMQKEDVDIPQNYAEPTYAEPTMVQDSVHYYYVKNKIK